MILIFGQRLCGRVDNVPGSCHVATRFFHLYYVPLIPLSSWIIPKNSGRDQQNVEKQIRLSFKSILFGWLQGFLVVFGLFDTLRGLLTLAKPGLPATSIDRATFELALGVSCLVVWLLFFLRPLRASENRAAELLQLLESKPEVVANQ